VYFWIPLHYQYALIVEALAYTALVAEFGGEVGIVYFGIMVCIYCSFDCGSLYGIINIHRLTLLSLSQNPNVALKMIIAGGNLNGDFPGSIAQTRRFCIDLWLF
jgi:hypothetical protein